MNQFERAYACHQKLNEINNEINQLKWEISLKEDEIEKLNDKYNSVKLELRDIDLEKLDPILQKSDEENKIIVSYLNRIHSIFIKREDVIKRTKVSKHLPKEVFELLQEIVEVNEKGGGIKIEYIDLSVCGNKPHYRVGFNRV